MLPTDLAELTDLIENRWGCPEDSLRARELVQRIAGRAAVDVSTLPRPVPTRPEAVRRIAIVVGHNPDAPGADLLPPLRQSEYVFNSTVAEYMRQRAPRPLEVQIFRRQASGSYLAEIAQVYEHVSEFDPVFALELHFNGGEGDYCTALVARTSPKGASLARTLLVHLSSGLGITNGDFRETGRTERGGASLYAAACPTVLMEPFFGDNPVHAAEIASMGPEGLAEIYLRGITSYLKG